MKRIVQDLHKFNMLKWATGDQAVWALIWDPCRFAGFLLKYPSARHWSPNFSWGCAIHAGVHVWMVTVSDEQVALCKVIAGAKVCVNVDLLCKSLQYQCRSVSIYWWFFIGTAFTLDSLKSDKNNSGCAVVSGLTGLSLWVPSSVSFVLFLFWLSALPWLICLESC